MMMVLISRMNGGGGGCKCTVYFVDLGINKTTGHSYLALSVIV